MRKMPFLRITISVIFGIYLANNFHCDSKLIFGLLFLCGASLFAFKFFSDFLRNISFFNTSLFLLFFIFLGAFAQKVSHFSVDKSHFSYYYNQDDNLVGEIEKVKLSKSAKYFVKINYQASKNSFLKLNGKLLLKSYNLDFKVGDVVSFKGNLSQFENQENVLAFDQQRFYNSKGIYHYMYSNDISLLKSNSSFILSLRESVKNKIQNLDVSSTAIALVQAMLLGDKTDLGELDEVFRKTGTSHVLAISGLHVGIITTILFFIFNYMPQKYERLKYAFVIIGVWVFCLLSGAMPSTVRASVMLTCFLIGKSLGRTGLSYNYCFAAAFLMLLKNPGLIYDVGFQFSFLAIFGILYFYDFIYKALQFKGFLNYAWQLFSVSLAAQLMIAPLSLYYFHDFPVLFLITSLVAIPATFIVILLAALSLILSSETFSFLSLEPILDWFVNSFISLLEIFTINEGFIIKGLFPNSLEIGLYYCALFSIVYYFTKRNKLALLTFVVSFSALFYYQYNINKDISGSSVIIYAHSSEIIIDVINAGSLLHIKEQAKSKSKYDWIANNRRIKNAVNYQQEIEIKAVNQVIEIQDFKLGIVYDESFFQSHEFESIDYLLLKRPIEYSCINEHSKVIDYTDSHNHLFINNKQTIIKI